MSDCKCCTDRRSFLKLGGMTLFISALSPSFVRAYGDSRLRGLSRLNANGRTLVTIYLRGGQDGLNVVVPTEAGEYATYRSYRPTLGIDQAQLLALPDNPDFALHPAMAALHELYVSQGNVALCPTVGYPDSSRSHFDGQEFMEKGTPWDKTTADGWINRWLQQDAGNGDPLRAIAFDSGLPLAMRGAAPAMSFSSLSDLAVSSDPTRDQRFLEIQNQIYAAMPLERRYDPEISAAGQGLVAAINAIRAADLPEPNPSTPYPNTTFGRRLSELAQLLRSGEFAIEAAEIDLGGWDTHTQQGQLTGNFPGLLQQLSEGLAAFASDLGPQLSDVAVMTMSEFGRTSRENGNAGTDHGSGAVGIILGGAVRGGVHFGSGAWYGLDDLRDDRDLKYSIDFRDYIGEALAQHLGDGSLPEGVFPGWSYTPQGII